MDTVRIGIIGTGHIALDHIQRLGRMGGAQVTAVSSRRREPAEKAAALCGARVEDDYRKVVQADDVDAVMVTSPSELHEEHVLAAIEAGKYVFCEKPLAVTAEGCRKIMEAEAAAGKRLTMV
ncbi:MAG: Gfo/Idh/MocA family oxidoreductase, partial [Eubacterium sp.]|nr:Gfo/Idh/MocA family oxidoreductase [Eubacterium sp.]